MALLYANNAAGTLAAGISNAATAVTLNPGQAALFPAPVAPDTFYATFTDAATQTIKEIVLVTTVAGNIFSITRAQDGTSALSWNAGDIISQNTVAAELRGFLTATSTPFPGTVLGVRAFSSTQVYTPTTGTNAVLVFLVGAGGAGGGSTATNAAQISVGAGGNSGSLCISRITAGFSGQTITIGAGSAGIAGAGGPNGGNSTFMAMVAAGGSGGNLSGAVAVGSCASAAPLGVLLASGGTVLNSATGAGTSSLFVQNQAALVGQGGGSPLGGGGGAGIFQGTGAAGATPGAAGGGTANGPSQPSIAGGQGANGYCIIYEYS